MNRKLIRPDLTEIKDHLPAPATPRYRTRKQVPPDATSAESFYYQKQMDNRTKMVIVLKDGEILHGTIEWYDRTAIKVNRYEEPNILLMKDAVKYMYKENDEED
jgi:host factor-I protein